ncbi:MAG: hypothetical protein PHS41_04850 [Victivallaceae bacterium]|nr:hypothetical protein [Victivallaceae bacterium]
MLQTSPYSSLKTSIRPDPQGADVEFEYEVKPHPNAREYQLVVEIAPQLLQAIPQKSKWQESARQGGILSLKTPVRTFEFDLQQYKIPARLEDRRHENWSRKFRIRFLIPYDSTKGIKGKCGFKLRIRDVAPDFFQRIDLTKFSNRGLTDQVANDKQGGWTDQGTNDLRSFRPGRIVSGGIPFEIGDRAIILQSKVRPYFPERSPEIPLGVCAERIAFCQTCAWGEEIGQPVFQYLFFYEDGTQEVFVVRYGMEVMDWWGGAEASRAVIAWKGMNHENRIAFLHAQWINPHPERKISKMQVVSLNTKSIPIVLGITAVRSDLPGFETKHFTELDDAFKKAYIQEIDHSQWFPCPIDWQGKIQPGSALDLSFLNHKPAGKYGFVKVTSNGKFEFQNRPGEALRFWGSNTALCGVFPPKDLAPKLARTFAAQGVNLIRIHLWAVQMDQNKKRHVEDEIINPDGSINEEVRDRLEFFISELKKNGIYIYMDWNDGMMYDRLVPEMPRITNYYLPENIQHSFKFYSLFYPPMIRGVEKLAEMVFLHKNPYTGLRMVDDPAFAVFEITNENSIFSYPNDGRCRPNLDSPPMKYLAELYNEYRKRKGLAPAAFSGKSTRTLPPEETCFFAELGKKEYVARRDFLRKIGVRVPICGSNWSLCTGDTWCSQFMDVTGVHSYALAVRNGRLPGTAGLTLMDADMLSLPFFPELSRGKIAGMPLTISEWQFEYPMWSRCEGMPFMTAAMSLNDWDLSLFYCATGSNNYGRWQTFMKDPRITTHTQQTDPATWGQTQAMAMIYRNCYLKTAPNVITMMINDQDVEKHVSPVSKYPFLTLMTRVETKFVPNGQKKTWPLDRQRSQQEVLDEARRKFRIPEERNALASETGEIRRCFDPGLLLIDAPKCCVAAGALSSMQSSGRSLQGISLQTSARFASFSLTSLDNKNLSRSKRMLITFVGDARNRSAKFSGDKHLEWGSSPVVAEPLTAVLIFERIPAEAAYKLYSLDPLTGQRVREIRSRTATGKKEFLLDTGSHRTIFYELIQTK